MKNIFQFLFLLFCLFTTTNPLQAQWIQTNGPYGGLDNILAASGTNLFAGTYGGGVFLSTNNGSSWSAVNTGLTSPWVFALTISGTNLFAGTGGGLFLSTNNGSNWSAVNTGLTYNVQAFTVSGTNLFAGTGGDLFLSTNNGSSWSAVNNGLTNNVQVLTVSGTNLFAGTGDGVFLSTNNGSNWSAVNTGLNSGSFGGLVVNALAASDANLFAGIWGGGVFLSTNNGSSWNAVNTGLTNTFVRALTISGTNLFAGTWNGGVFLSTNNGSSWNAVNTGLTNTDVYAFTVSGTNLFAGTYGSVWRRPLSEMITSVGRLSSDLPAHFSLNQNYPNPFNPSTNISFTIPSRSFVLIKVFDALGREIATIVSEELVAGSYSKQWNTAIVSSGTYFYRMQAGSFSETKKLVILK